MRTPFMLVYTYQCGICSDFHVHYTDNPYPDSQDAEIFLMRHDKAPSEKLMNVLDKQMNTKQDAIRELSREWR